VTKVTAKDSTPRREREKTTRARLLLVEDNRESAQLIRDELADRGFSVQLSFDGRDGFAAILKHRPDLVLCDVGMPQMSGFELLEKIVASEPRFEAMPFIFLTALADRESELKGRRLGADDYVTKPIDYDRLEAIIQSRLTAAARARGVEAKPLLTPNEIEALNWAARGKTSLEIAKITGMVKRTVDFHIDNARRKLSAKTRTQAVTKAVAMRLISPWTGEDADGENGDTGED
jgi:DNA-binding response OmpR family regulator